MKVVFYLILPMKTQMKFYQYTYVQFKCAKLKVKWFLHYIYIYIVKFG